MNADHTPGPSSTTASDIGLPWADEEGGAADVLHLVIAWSLDEPDRIGETAPIGAPCLVGRGSPEADPFPRACFSRVRPGLVQACPPLETRRLSRKQLVCEPAGAEAVRIRNVGKRAMSHNGRFEEEGTFVAGDTLALQDAMLFVVEKRPRLIPRSMALPAGVPDFPFGEPDAQGFVGESPASWRLRKELAIAARADAHVLVLGESGTGKELAALLLHELSERRARPLVSRNAATIPDSLADAEFFGNRENYPNPGMAMRPGLIGEANGGNLFLDEIGELPEKLQSHLLRVLDARGDYQRLGDARTLRSDFRLFAATNRPLSALKHDLLARFALRIRVPGLNERRSDIAFIARKLLRDGAHRTADNEAAFVDVRTDGTHVPRLDPALMDALVRHTYHHHVRELRRLLMCSAASSTGQFLKLTDAVLRDLSPPSAHDGGEPSSARLRHALAKAQGNKNAAAKLLGLPSRFALYRLMRKHGL
jgi:two-component system nitrogen regulation response regulator GlnG/two-component system response regulator HydG